MSKFPTLKILNIALEKVRETESLLTTGFDLDDFHDGDESVMFTSLKHDVKKMSDELLALIKGVNGR